MLQHLKKKIFNPMKKFEDDDDDEAVKEGHSKEGHSKFAMDYCASIQVDPETNNPTKVWDKYKIKRIVKKVKMKNLSTPIFEDRVRVVCLSDTHMKIEDKPEVVPDGDILIHAGDFTNIGLPSNIEKFNEFLGKLPHRHKVVIAGNHDQTFMDNNDDFYHSAYSTHKVCAAMELFRQTDGKKSVKGLLTNCIYLQDSAIELYGIKFYGSPWSPEFCNWAFNVERGEEILKIWNQIPEETDILITHGPPLGYGDMNYDGLRTGCVELLNTIQKRVRPKYHIYGHIHEGYGVLSDGYTTYINASTCNLRYKPENPPIIFDVPLPAGCTKDESLKNCLTVNDQPQGGACAL
ncbi:hypothetical protein ScPMuIL_012479 [Solemya velum]